MNSKDTGNKITGVILCGGRSSRMGSDKGLLKRENEFYSRICSELLKNLTDEVVFSINESQLPGYRIAMPDNVYVTDSVSIPGPFAGIASVHKFFPGSDLFVIACDMPDLDLRVIEKIYTGYLDDPGYDFYVYQDSEYIQALCGIYSSSALRRFCEDPAGLSGTDFSLKTILKSSNTKYFQISTDIREFFRNYNLPEDLYTKENA
ncbi:MAG: molybdenum cofactor guanylyltransferase [Leptospira sp.]|nr:molybdenum cofactor guanylyltransferase [Leptospira sp.]